LRAANKEAVILVPGLWLPRWSLEWLRRRLAREGYDARLFGYRTVKDSFAQNAARLAAFADGLDAAKLHFVGHSLGGLVIRALLASAPPARLGRIVTLGTPHNGSFVAARFARYRGGGPMMGRGIGALLAGRPHEWPRPPCELGIIAGDLGLGLGRLVAPDLPSPHDGTVAVVETQFVGAADHITLHVSHLGMLVSPAVARQTVCFLRSGRFCRREAH
jgi:pimeloyl-ACP methyl ester carboxylesterase